MLMYSSWDIEWMHEEHVGVALTSALSMKLLDPEVRERMNRDTDIKIPSTNGVLSSMKQRRFVLPPPPPLSPLTRLILWKMWQHSTLIFVSAVTESLCVVPLRIGGWVAVVGLECVGGEVGGQQQRCRCETLIIWEAKITKPSEWVLSSRSYRMMLISEGLKLTWTCNIISAAAGAGSIQIYVYQPVRSHLTSITHIHQCTLLSVSWDEIKDWTLVSKPAI